MSPARALLAVHFSAFLLGMVGIVVKMTHLPAAHIVFGRVLFAALSLMLLLPFIKQLKELNWRVAGLIAVNGVILAVHWLCFFKSLQAGSVPVTLVTFSTYAIFTALIEPALSRNFPSNKNLILAQITFIGVAMMVVSPDSIYNSEQILMCAFWGILSGLSFAILQIFNCKYARLYGATTVTFIQDAGAVLFMLPVIFIWPVYIGAGDMTKLFLLGYLFTAIGHTLIAYGLRAVTALTASLVITLEPVYGTIFSIIILDQKITGLMIAGGLLVMGAALSTTFEGLRKEKEDQRI